MHYVGLLRIRPAEFPAFWMITSYHPAICCSKSFRERLSIRP